MDDIDLSGFALTKSQTVDFLQRLSLVSESIYRVDFDLEKALQGQFGIEKKDKLLSLIRKNKIPPGSSTALAEFLAKLQETISSLPVVSIVLAIEPNDEILKAIFDWFPINLKKQVMVDIQIDPKLVAGCKVSFQGKQKDASIKPLFENICTTLLSGNVINEKQS